MKNQAATSEGSPEDETELKAQDKIWRMEPGTFEEIRLLAENQSPPLGFSYHVGFTLTHHIEQMGLSGPGFSPEDQGNMG